MPTWDEVAREGVQLDRAIRRGEVKEADLTDKGRVALALVRRQVKQQDLTAEGKAVLGVPRGVFEEVGRGFRDPRAETLPAGLGQMGRRAHEAARAAAGQPLEELPIAGKLYRAAAGERDPRRGELGVGELALRFPFEAVGQVERMLNLPFSAALAAAHPDPKQQEILAATLQLPFLRAAPGVPSAALASRRMLARPAPPTAYSPEVGMRLHEGLVPPPEVMPAPTRLRGQATYGAFEMPPAQKALPAAQVAPGPLASEGPGGFEILRGARATRRQLPPGAREPAALTPPAPGSAEFVAGPPARAAEPRGFEDIRGLPAAPSREALPGQIGFPKELPPHIEFERVPPPEPAPTGGPGLVPPPVPRPTPTGRQAVTPERGAVNLSDPDDVYRWIRSEGGMKPTRDHPDVPKGVLNRQGRAYDELVQDLAKAQGKKPREVERELFGTLRRYGTLRGEKRAGTQVPREGELQGGVHDPEPPPRFKNAITQDEWSGMNPEQRSALMDFFTQHGATRTGLLAALGVGTGAAAAGLRPPPSQGDQGRSTVVDRLKALAQAGIALAPLLAMARGPKGPRVPRKPGEPLFEQTKLGEQALIPGTEARAIPKGPLEAPVTQKPVSELPLFAKPEEVKQPELLLRPGERGAFTPGTPFGMFERGLRPPPGVPEATTRPPEVPSAFRRETIRPPEVRVDGELPAERPGAFEPPTVGGPGGPPRGPRGPAAGVFDPKVPPNQPPHQTFWDRIRHQLQRRKEQLPQELPIITRRPQSPVISVVERHSVGLEEDLSALLKEPWATSLHRYSPQEWMQYEQQAVDLWKAGGSTPESRAAAIRQLPEDLRGAIAFRDQMFAQDQFNRTFLGLPLIPERPGPYLPRLTDEQYREVVTLGRYARGLGADLQTTVRSFQQERVFETQLEGIAHGIVYEDPRVAWLLREWNSIKLNRTARLVEDLEGTVLFRSPEEARAANPSSRPVPLEGLPGSRRWYVPSREEAIFLKHNLVRSEGRDGPLGVAVHYANQLLRNPNLFNPLPHFLKNMLYKYGLARGAPTVARDMAEYWRRGDGHLARQFETVMPFTKTGRTANDMLQEHLGRGPVDRILRAVGTINRPSSRAIFAKLDPALRYARWKQYVRRGMTPQEAANHTWVDLIRYGTRSDLVDAWKALPGNFFVPWRVGTVTSLIKQIRSHPIRAALFVAGVDYMREAYYRQTGQYMHLPIDYLENPIAQAIDDPKTALPIVATTLAFGPGGAMTVSIGIDMLKALQGKEDWGRMQNLFWGVSQAFNIPHEMMAYEKDGNLQHFLNILTGAALGTHEAIKYEPRRLAKWLPEWLPGMVKAQGVRMLDIEAEERQRRAEQARANQLAAEGRMDDARDVIAAWGALHEAQIGLSPSGVQRRRQTLREQEDPIAARTRRLSPAARAKLFREMEEAGR